MRFSLMRQTVDTIASRVFLVPVVVPGGLTGFERTVVLERSRTELFYYDAGSPDLPAMLLVHGLGDEADTWRRVIRPLSETHRVIAPDLPGFGRSPMPRHRLSPGWLSRVLLELLQALGIEKAAWIGSSLGASISQIACLSNPGKATRLVLVDGGLLAVTGLTPTLLMMMAPGAAARRFTELSMHPEAAFASLGPYYARLDLLPGTERDFLQMRVMERLESGTYLQAYLSMLRSYTLWALLNGPRWVAQAKASMLDTLYIWGADDAMVPIRAGREGCAAQHGARIQVIPGAGHLPHQEAPDLFLSCLGS
jgi:pimeloyl-ACP methyl ester carboxylesterase